ncbi:MAG: hypothetical protein ACJAZN_001177 [Planctomycetota bacterium]|jgi:hypothetical protein
MMIERLNQRPAAFFAVVTSFLLGLMLAGCGRASLEVTEAIPTAFDGARTYAWVGNAPAVGRVGIPAGQEAVAAGFRRLLDDELVSRGFQKVGRGSAQFEAGLFLGVEKGARTSDPQFTVYPAERLERGHVVFTLTDAESETVAWTATASRVLRVTERGMGQGELRWTGTEEVRDWRIDDLSQLLGTRLP